MRYTGNFHDPVVNYDFAKCAGIASSRHKRKVTNISAIGITSIATNANPSMHVRHAGAPAANEHDRATILTGVATG